MLISGQLIKLIEVLINDSGMGSFFETLDFLRHITIQHQKTLKMLSPIAVLIVDEIVDLLKSIPEGATPEVTDFEHWGKEFASVWVSNI